MTPEAVAYLGETVRGGSARGAVNIPGRGRGRRLDFHACGFDGGTEHFDQMAPIANRAGQFLPATAPQSPEPDQAMLF